MLIPYDYKKLGLKMENYLINKLPCKEKNKGYVQLESWDIKKKFLNLQ